MLFILIAASPFQLLCCSPVAARRLATSAASQTRGAIAAVLTAIAVVIAAIAAVIAVIASSCRIPIVVDFLWWCVALLAALTISLNAALESIRAAILLGRPVTIGSTRLYLGLNRRSETAWIF